MPKVPRSVRLMAFIITTIVAALAAIGIGIAYGYNDTFYPGVTVGGVKLGGLNQQQARAKLGAVAQTLADRKVTVSIPDVSQSRDAITGTYPLTTSETTAGALGFSLPEDSVLSQAWGVGHQEDFWPWLKGLAGLVRDSGRAFPLVPTASDDATHQFVMEQVVAKAVAPKPAKMSIDKTTVTVEAEQPGLQVDDATLTAQIVSALSVDATATTLAFKLDPTLSTPAITTATVQPLADKLSQLGDTKVTLSSLVAGTKLVPDRTELLQWFIPVQNEQGAVDLSVNSERIAHYLQVSGKTLDQTKALASIAQEATTWLKTPKPSAQLALAAKPTAAVTSGTYKAGLFEGKYVYVNVAEQKLYRMNGQTMEKVYRVSTGKWSTPTPHGTFTIGGKTARAYSRTYGLYMPYWQNFLGTSTSGEDLPLGSYGLHELPEWPNGYKEGQGHLGTPVSHGCVRLGIGDAAEVYNWTETGTPVVIE